MTMFKILVKIVKMYFYLFDYIRTYLLFGNSGVKGRSDGDIDYMPFIENESWFIDLQKLSNDELMRMYNTITTGRYEFAKDAWYIPLSGDKRCPIMVAKGYEAPDTPQKMAEFEDTAKILEQEYRRFIDAWDFGYITKYVIEKAILTILELRSIAIIEYTH
jgi:hypothetical protein